MGAVGVLVHPTMEVPPQWAKRDGSRRRTRPIRHDLADDWKKKFFWSDGSTIAKASTRNVAVVM
jgi:hypothetical protein